MKYVIKTKDGAYKRYPGDSLSSQYTDTGYSCYSLDSADHYDSYFSAKDAMHEKGKFSESEGCVILGIEYKEIELNRCFCIYPGFGTDPELAEKGVYDISYDYCIVLAEWVGLSREKAIEAMELDLKRHGIHIVEQCFENDKIDMATKILIECGWKSSFIPIGP